jgi:hypothetical protein
MPISGRTMSRSVISKTSSCVMPSVIAVQTYGQTCGKLVKHRSFK